MQEPTRRGFAYALHDSNRGNSRCEPAFSFATVSTDYTDSINKICVISG